MRYQCVACGSEAVRVLKLLKRKRPNGDPMEALKCVDCNCQWEE